MFLSSTEREWVWSKALYAGILFAVPVRPRQRPILHIGHRFCFRYQPYPHRTPSRLSMTEKPDPHTSLPRLFPRRSFFHGTEYIPDSRNTVHSCSTVRMNTAHICPSLLLRKGRCLSGW